MTEENTQTEKKVEEAVVETASKAATAPAAPAKPEAKRDERPRRPLKRNPRRDRRPRERAKPEFEQKILSIRRVTRVVAGGRRFSFSVSLAAGDGKGKVGVGIGKAGDTALAIEKAFKVARKSMVVVPMTANKSIAHDVSAKYASSRIELRPAKGRGLVAGGAVRTILELAGMTDVTSKILSRSKNHLNNARATTSALEQLIK